MDWKIPLFKTYADQDDVESVSRVIRRGTFWASGPEVEQFERGLEKYSKSSYALSFNSGTSALHAILHVADLKGKEVLVPSFTFISTANAVILAGGRPSFAEIEDETLGLDLEDLQNRITPRTRGILLMHYGGYPAKDTIAIKNLAEDKNLILIEDVAESMGAKINGKMLGTFGRAGMLSFCQNKVMSTGEGGALITDSRDIIEKAKLFRSHGRLEIGEDYFTSTGDMDYIELGYNYRMSTMTAALGNAQLNKIDSLIEMRRKLAHLLIEELQDIEEISFPKEIPNHFQVYQLFPIFLASQDLRDKLQAFLSTKGIMSKVYFQPAHLKTYYKQNFGYKEGDLPRTEEISRLILNLPFYPHMEDENRLLLTQSIHEFIRQYRNNPNFI